VTKVRSSSNFSKNIALKVAKKVKSLHVSIIKEEEKEYQIKQDPQ